MPSFVKRIDKGDLGNIILMDRKSELEWREKALDLTSGVGMWCNVYADAVVCAIGAKAVYDSKYAQYIKSGMTKEDAERKAIQDAETSFNTSQQSTEGAYLAPVQMDKNMFVAGLTVYRTSSFQYTRNFIHHSRNLTSKLIKKDAQGKLMSPSEIKQQQIAFRMGQYKSYGLTDEQAYKAAERDYKKSIATDALGVALYGIILNIIWRLAGNFPYLFFGDDDEKKKELLKDALSYGVYASPISGMIGGNIIESALDGQGRFVDFLTPAVPFTQDVYRAADYIKGDRYVEFASQLASILLQTTTGLDPQVVSDLVYRIATTVDTEQDLDAAEKALRMSYAVLSVPQSQYEQILLEKATTSRREERKALKDYKEYYKMRTAPTTWWFRSKEEEEKVLDQAERRFYKLLDERKELKKD
jgi:hypothetical protein